MGGEFDAAQIANGNHGFGKKKRGGVKKSPEGIWGDGWFLAGDMGSEAAKWG